MQKSTIGTNTTGVTRSNLKFLFNRNYSFATYMKRLIFEVPR